MSRGRSPGSGGDALPLAAIARTVPDTTLVAVLGALGVQYSAELNEQRSGEPRVISTPDSAIPVLVVPTDEEQAIGALTLQVARQHGRL